MFFLRIFPFALFCAFACKKKREEKARHETKRKHTPQHFFSHGSPSNTWFIDWSPFNGVPHSRLISKFDRVHIKSRRRTLSLKASVDGSNAKTVHIITAPKISNVKQPSKQPQPACHRTQPIHGQSGRNAGEQQAAAAPTESAETKFASTA